MKYNTVMDLWQTAIKQSFTTQQDPDSGVITRTYYDDGVIQLKWVSKQIGNAIIYTKVEMKPFERIRMIVDRGGVPINDDVFYVQTEYSTINPFGFSDGYAYKVGQVAKDELVTTP